jgi:hypothetical protein
MIYDKVSYMENFMDQETFANHISKLGKNYFEIACKILLTDAFGLKAINVDGRNDGGTDFSSFDCQGKRNPVAYQITTQKSDIKRKIWNDAQKSIEKLGVNRFFFFCSLIISETELRKTENEISIKLGIQATFYDANIIAGLLLDYNLTQIFLSRTETLLSSKNKKFITDYKGLALYSYTLFSDESRKFKANIYDDTILSILFERHLANQKQIELEIIKLLNIDDETEYFIKTRIDSLMARGKIIVNENKEYLLEEQIRVDISTRKILYEREMADLISAQADILHEHGIQWLEDDSKKISFEVVSAYIYKQLDNLKQAKSTLVMHPIFNNFSNNAMGFPKINYYTLFTEGFSV